MIQVVLAPTINAYLEHTAYGTISPNIVIIAVDTINPVTPDVKSPMNIARAELTVTFPRRMVHNKKLPLLLSGKIAAAYLASLSSSSLLKGPFVISSRFLTSRPRRPRFRPEKVPDRDASTTIARI